ncbi:hypothetical protein [Azospirillum palustre]
MQSGVHRTSIGRQGDGAARRTRRCPGVHHRTRSPPVRCRQDREYRTPSVSQAEKSVRSGAWSAPMTGGRPVRLLHRIGPN